MSSAAYQAAGKYERRRRQLPHVQETSLRDSLLEKFLYIRALFSDLRVASLAPSSPFLAQTVCELSEVYRARTVIELGAGEGAVTKYLLNEMNASSSLYAFELNGELVSHLKNSVCDWRLKVIHDDAVNLTALCELKDLNPECVVSSIPFTFFSEEKALSILRSIACVLKPGGNVVIYQTWLPPFFTAMRCRELMSHYFDEVSVTQVYRNLPPLIVIKATPKRDVVRFIKHRAQ